MSQIRKSLALLHDEQVVTKDIKERRNVLFGVSYTKRLPAHPELLLFQMCSQFFLQGNASC